MFRRYALNIDLWLYSLLIVVAVGVLGLIVWRLNNTHADNEPVIPPPTARIEIADSPSRMGIDTTPSPSYTPTLTHTPTLTLTPNMTPTVAPYSPLRLMIPQELPPTRDTPFVPRVDHINGMHIRQFIALSPDVQSTVRTIYALGQTLGRNPQAFSKLGDSTIANPFFMGYFDDGRYNLAAYHYLQPVIDYFLGSFGRESVAVRVGLHSWSVMDPMWATGLCAAGEHMLACEFRLNNPAFLFIRLGSNDAGVPNTVERSLREIIVYCMENGVVPILGTKADRFEGNANTNNTIIRNLAEEFNIPLWDFDILAGTIAGRGLTSDNVHMTNFFPLDYGQTTAFQRGHSVHSLSALMVLELMLAVVNDTPLPDLVGG
jgi:hypothetical protein